MKKNLIKMRVCLGFGCNPRLDIISYEDEITKDGKVYQSSKGIRNEKTAIDFGQIWMKMDNSSNAPYWDAYVILDKDVATNETIAEKAVELQRMAMDQMKQGLENGLAQFNAMKLPSVAEMLIQVEGKMNSNYYMNTGVSIPIEEFKKKIGENVLNTGRKFAVDNKYNVDMWNKFYSETLTPEVLSLLMKGLPVLKVVGDNIEFQSNEMYKQALDAVSMKVTSDVFARFVETMNNQAK